jgi:hypothetical protein
LAVVLIYLILAPLFGSFLQPLRRYQERPVTSVAEFGSLPGLETAVKFVDPTV